MSGTKRRKLLRALGVGAFAGLAGCSLLGNDSPEVGIKPGSGSGTPDEVTPTKQRHPEVNPTMVEKLTPTDGNLRDRFSTSIALTEDYAAVGAPGDNRGGPESLETGSTYTFSRTGTQFDFGARFAPRGDAEFADFGHSVAATNDTILVGAPRNDTEDGTTAGSAHVFTLTDGEWTHQSRLRPDDGRAYQRFGISVALAEDRAVVGAWPENEVDDRSGAAYVFTRGGGVWTQSATLTPEDSVDEDAFGGSIAVDGQTVFVGAANDGENGTNAGAAYVFSPSSGRWQQEAKLLPEDGDIDDRFGRAVAARDGRVLIGAPGDNEDYLDSVGAVYAFHLTDGEWTTGEKITHYPDDATDRFGSTIALGDEIALIGSPTYDKENRSEVGSTYVFTRYQDDWQQASRIRVDDGDEGDRFGSSLAIDGRTALIGTQRDDNQNGSLSGSMYIFEL